MRWFHRVAVGIAVALCAWWALPRGAGAAPKPPRVQSIIEGRDTDGAPIVIVIGVKVNALKDLSVVADDGVSPRYEDDGSLVVKSGKLSVWRLPENIEQVRGPDQYSLVFTYGRRRTELPVPVRLDFGAAPPRSVGGASIENAIIDTQHLTPGLLQDLEDASTLNGFDSDFLRDASNLTGTLDLSRFSAWDDLDDENRIGTDPGQLAVGNHTHPGSFYLQSELNGTGGVINTSTNPLDWSRLKSVPLGFADGDDADTTYSTGPGLTQTGTIFGVDFDGGGAADTVARSDHDHGNVFAPIGHNHDTRYPTSSSLAADDTTINDADDPVHWTQLTGVPTSIADGVDADTTYIAGTGLSLASGTLSVNLAGTGTANSAARSDHDHTGTYADASHAHDSRYATKTALGSDTGIINAVGNPVDWSQLKNVPDAFADGTDDSIVYSAGDGLIVSTNQFSVLFGGTGSATNVARSDHLHAGTYQPAFNVGTGLNLSLNTLAVSYGGNGSDTNVARADHNHNTIYPLASDLSSTGGTINQVTNPLDWSQMKSVPTGFIDGIDDDTLYSAGNGLTLTNTTFDVDFAGGGTATTASRSDHDHGGSFVLVSPSSTQTGTVDVVSGSTTITAETTASSGSAGKFEASEPSGGTAIGVEAISESHWAVKATGATRGVSATATATSGSAGYFDNLATSGTPRAVYAWNRAPGGTGVYGFSQPSTGTGKAIHGETFSPTGFAIYGENLSNGFNSIGVFGEAFNGAGVRGEGGTGVSGGGSTAGVFGEVTATNGGYGVHGKVTNSNGYGVYAESTTGGQTSYGLYAKSAGTAIFADGGWQGLHATSSNRPAVFAENTSTGSPSYGIHGTTASNGSAAIYGEATSTTGSSAHGVHGEANSTSSAGVYGSGPSTSSGTGVIGAGLTGVYGTSIGSLGFGVRGVSVTNGVGVRGETLSGIGVSGEATTSGAQVATGVYGKSAGTTGYGVLGENVSASATGGAVAVRGDSRFGIGVQGSTGSVTQWAGVFGEATATSAISYGVHGKAGSTAGYGVLGDATASTGSTRGVAGQTASDSGNAGWFENTKGGSSSAVLFVNHADTVTTTGDLAVFQDQGTNVARIDRSGQGFFNGGTATSGADVAESVAVDRPKAEFEPGDVMIVDRKAARRFAKSGKRNSPLVAGIYATKPGVLLRPGPVDDPTQWAHREVPMAVTGIVPCKVCDENGEVEIGDLLVTSSKPGYAMKAPDDPKAGTLVGKALEALDGPAGKVEVLITMR